MEQIKDPIIATVLMIISVLIFQNCHIRPKIVTFIIIFFCLDISLLLIFIRPKQTTGRATVDQGSTEDNRVTVTWQDHTRDKDEIVITIQEKTFIINHQL